MKNEEKLQEYTDWLLIQYEKKCNQLMKSQSFMMNLPWYVMLFCKRRIHKFVRSQFDE